jgi:cell wall-associated NlpC family hydrolase
MIMLTSAKAVFSRNWRVSVASGTVAVLALVLVVFPGSARADNYPSWDDVQAARSSQAATQVELNRIDGLVAGLQTTLASSQAEASRRWDENQAAQTAFNEAKAMAQSLAAEAASAKTQADKSRAQAAVLAAQFARSGGNDLSARLLVDSQNAGDLLYKLGAMSKLSETTTGLYQQATRDENGAKSLGDQAVVAEDALGALAAVAAATLTDAVAAQQSVQSALVAQESHSAQLAVQKRILTEGLNLTEAGYQAGVEAERLARIQAEQVAAEAAAAATAAAAAAAEAAANTPAPGPNQGASGGSGSGSVGGDTTPITIAPPSSGSGAAVVAFAEQFVGVVPYGWGASPDTSFGCDGLTQYVYGQFGIKLSRLVSNQAAAGIRISAGDAQAGDLVVWPGAHIGIYDGDGGVIHSPNWGRFVEHRHNLWGSYYFVRILF